jgi:hypothetical protein
LINKIKEGLATPLPFLFGVVSMSIQNKECRIMALMLASCFWQGVSAENCKSHSLQQEQQTMQKTTNSTNRQTIVQNGKRNEKFIEQSGVNNELTLTQNGDDNRVGFRQEGEQNDATVTQTGDCNDSSISQAGNNNQATIRQSSGHNRAVISQSN